MDFLSRFPLEISIRDTWMLTNCKSPSYSSRYSSTLVPVLEHLRATIVDDLNTRRGALHKMEYVTLVEALVLISNQVLICATSVRRKRRIQPLGTRMKFD